MNDVIGSEKRLGGDGSAVGEAMSSTMKHATDAIERLLAATEQATTTLRELSRSSGEWVEGAQQRARDMAREVRSHGERAVGTMSRRVEEYPLSSLAVAFGVGCMLGMLIRRRR